MRLRLHLTLCVALALAACGGETKKETGGTAGGEILPASVSDDMLPHDSVRSQAPLAPQAAGGEAGKDRKNGMSDMQPKAETASAAAAPSEAPAEGPESP